MRREAITLILAMAASTILMAACDKGPQPETRGTPPAASTPPASPSATPAPPPPVAASPTERKDGQPPIQGQVDSNQPAQRKDFQTTK